MKNHDINRAVQQLKNRLTGWCVLAIVLEIIAIVEPLPFIRIVAWLAIAYCVLLLLMLGYLLVIKFKK